MDQTWEDMKHNIYTFVVECDTCQCNKDEIIKTPCTLQLLPIPPVIWMNILMEFIVGLPKSGNKSVIMVLVDCISKYSHLCAIQHPFTTSMVTQSFIDNVFKLHGMPHYSIVFDHDPTFTDNFGKNCSRSKEPNYILAWPIILGLTDKLKLSTSAWKHIWGVLRLTYKLNGLNGYH